jgi:hypothetical protein
MIFFEENKPLNKQILESLQPILSSSKHVSINEEQILNFVLEIDDETMSKFERDDFFCKIMRKHVPNKGDAIDLLGAFNSINFCYWSKNKADKWRYTSKISQKEEDGATALFLALIENYKKDNNIFTGSNLKALDQKNLKTIIINRNNIPLFNERLHILRDFGKTIETKYLNHFYNFVEVNARFKASKIITNLLFAFPSFNDSYKYNDKWIWFLKRAQLLLSMIHDQFEDFFDISVVEELTAFADYKIPMMLEKEGILKYSNELKEKIEKRELIPKDSRMELEIRASMIQAIEEIKKKSRRKITSAHIDNLLWEKSQRIHGNYHLTLTTAY